MPVFNLFTFTLTVFRPRPPTCLQQTHISLRFSCKTCRYFKHQISLWYLHFVAFSVGTAFRVNCDSSVGIATSLRAARSGAWIPAGGREFSPSLQRPDRQRAHTTSSSTETGTKRPGCEVDHTHCHLAPRLKMSAAMNLQITYVYVCGVCRNSFTFI